MTLIIGKKRGSSIRFVSDSKITDENLVRNNPLLGSLKLFILDPKICLGFSGNLHFAEKLLEEYYSNKVQSFPFLLQRCLSLNKESDNSTFFVLGTLFSNIPELYKIYDGKIEANQKDIWIGDKLGFNKFQETYHNDMSDADDFSKMENAFDSVIKDEKITTVNDFQISVETNYINEINKTAFIYTFKTIMNVVPQRIVQETKIGENESIIQVEFGGAELGGFGMSYLRSRQYGLPAIAIHFPQGEFGVLFCPKINLNKPVIFKNQKNGEDFVYEVKKKYGIPLQGFVSENNNSFKNVSG